MRNGPRDLDSILDARYWLTDKGIAATDAHRADQAATNPDDDGDDAA